MDSQGNLLSNFPKSYGTNPFFVLICKIAKVAPPLTGLELRCKLLSNWHVCVSVLTYTCADYIMSYSVMLIKRR